MMFNIFKVFIVIFFLQMGKSKTPSGSSNLKKVYDDLAILSRITNAISLQSAALDNSIDTANVTSELLKINVEKLMEIVSLNMTHILDDFNNLNKSISSAVGKKNITSLEGFAAASYMLIWTKDIANITMLNEISSQRFLELSKKVSIDGTICENGDVKMFVQFWEAVNEYPMTEDERQNALRSFINSIAKVEECYKNIGKPSGNVKQWIQESKNIKTIWNSRNLLEVFHNQTANDRIQEYRDIKKVFDNATAVMNEDDISSVRKTLERVKGLVTYMSNSKHSDPPVFTAGFSSFEDLTNVSKDLDTDWFKDEIAQGKMNDKLQKALTPFNEFAKEVETLKAYWESFTTNSQENVLSELSDIFKVLPDFNQWTKKNFTDILTFANSSYQDCWVNISVGNGTFSSDLDEARDQLDLMVQSVAAIEKWVEGAKKETNPNFLEVLKSFKELLGDSEHSDVLIDKIQRIPNYESLNQFSRRFKDLHQLHTKLNITVTDWQSSNQSLVVGLGPLVTNLNLEERQKCLKKYKELDAEALGNLTVFMENVFRFRNSSEYYLIKTVAGDIEALQSQLIKVESFTMKLKQKYDKDPSANLVLQLKNSSSLSQSLGNGMNVLRQMVEVHRLQDNLLQMATYEDDSDAMKVILTSDLPTDVEEFFKNRKSKIRLLVDEVNKLESSVGSLKGKDLLTMGSVFEKATTVQGIPNALEFTYNKWKESGTAFQMDAKRLEELKDLDLEFASHKGDLNAASLSLQSLRQFFDEFFDLKPKTKSTQPTSVTQLVTDPLYMFLGCLVLLVLLVVGFLVIYGLTKTGRERYRKLWFYYFGRQKAYEKRWRYSLFMDRVDINKNVVCDAVREVNAQNLLVAVKSGAYINAYNKFGNTGLHVATKRGYYKLVDILIRHGADRNLLNAENKTPEQMIKVMNTESQSEEEREEAEKYKKIEMIYNKYRNKSFKKRVPGLFPLTSFHIHMDEQTEEKVTVQFTKKFEAITSSEPLPTTTHFVVKTNNEGALESDDLNVLSWIFNGVIIVKESWMTDCLKNEKLIHKDIDYLVDKVKYKGVVYENSILPWSQAMAKGTMPYLYGAQVAVTIRDYQNLFTLAAIVNNQGGVMLNQFPDKDQYNKGSHPYLHQHLGPIFLIHDGSIDLSVYKNDPDRMFTLFTEPEFIIFLLKREINIDKSPNPVPVLNEIDD